MIETKECTFSDPTYQAVPMAPSTCNDVHSLSFHLPLTGSYGSNSSSRSRNDEKSGITLQYLARGGYRDVWALTQPINNYNNNHYNNDDDDNDDTEYDNGKSIAIAAMKTNRLDKHDWWSIFNLEKYRRDALISERAGRLESSTLKGNNNHHVVPLYHYCAFSSIVPYSTSGPLDLYVHGRVHDKYNIRTTIMDPIEIYILAMQAARGVYQAHLYKDGVATNAIADIKPPQFLLFTRQEQEQQQYQQEQKKLDEEDYSDSTNDDALMTTETTTKTTTQRAMEEYINVPIVQLQDFNRGRYLGRHRTTTTGNNKTCGFQICNIDKFWNFRSPEEYSGLTTNGYENCMYQDDKIDTWALGAVFYFLLSDGRIPFYYIMDNNDHHSRKKKNNRNNDFSVVMQMILDGITSKLPEELLSSSDDDDEEEEEMVIMNDMMRKLNMSLKSRSKHPAYVALKEVMLACWEYNPEVRPSSLKVVQMLEEMWDKVNI
jgi:serine/threonine protein kinase